MRVLVLCTANQCRSPMGEVLLRARLAERGVEADVSSAGRLPGDVVASEGARIAMAERGLDLGSHRSRTCTVADLRDADLVIGMAREHVRDAVLSQPDAFSRTYTLKELARRAAAVGPRSGGEDLARYLGRVHAGRTHAELLGASAADDVEDPMGGTPRQYEATARELEALVDKVVGLLWPAAVVHRSAGG